MARISKIEILILGMTLCLSACSSNRVTLFSAADHAEEAEAIIEETADSAYSYITEDFYVQNGDSNIYGLLYRPSKEGILPTVIISHGFGGNYQTNSSYAEAFVQQGYNVYCFDFCGGSGSSRSDGTPLEMSMLTEVSDLEAVIQTVSSLDYVDTNNIFLMGTSQGGAVSAVAGSREADLIKGMMLLYPAFNMPEEIQEAFSNQAIPDTFQWLWMEVGRIYAEDIIDYDIYEEIQNYEKDVLIIHGDADATVPLAYSNRALEVFPSASLEVIESAGHGFYGSDQTSAVQYMLEYLNRQRSVNNE